MTCGYSGPVVITHKWASRRSMCMITKKRGTDMDDDIAQIVATAHDYFDGYFDGDAARMERALHRDLVKRSRGQDQAATLGFIPAEQMITCTSEGEGKQVAAGLTDRTIEV